MIFLRTHSHGRWFIHVAADSLKSLRIGTLMMQSNRMLLISVIILTT